MVVDIWGCCSPLLPWTRSPDTWNILPDQSFSLTMTAIHPHISCVHSPWRILPSAAGNCEHSHFSNFGLSTPLNTGGLEQHLILFGIFQECSCELVTDREASYCAGGWMKPGCRWCCFAECGFSLFCLWLVLTDSLSVDLVFRWWASRRRWGWHEGFWALRKGLPSGTLAVGRGQSWYINGLCCISLWKARVYDKGFCISWRIIAPVSHEGLTE